MAYSLKYLIDVGLVLAFFLLFSFPLLLRSLFKAQGIRAGRQLQMAFGPVAMINNIYLAQGCRLHGILCEAVSYEADRITGSLDFDKRLQFVRERGFLSVTLNSILSLIYAVWRFDCLVIYLNGGYLYRQRSWWLEWLFWRVSGVKIIALPYGSDVAVPGFMGPQRIGLEVTQSVAWKIKQRVDHFCRYASLVIRTLQVGYLPHSDVWLANMLAVDMEECAKVRAQNLRRCKQRSSDKADILTIFHSANHAAIKGTEFLHSAVQRLQKRGYQIHLITLEKCSRDEILTALEHCDLVVDQLYAGYGMFAIEALSRGVPVISSLGWISQEALERYPMSLCPIIDANVDTIVDVLEDILKNRSALIDLSEKSWKFAENVHGLKAAGMKFYCLVRHICYGDTLPDYMKNLSSNDGYHYVV